jgi:hypothetical protein
MTRHLGDAPTNKWTAGAYAGRMRRASRTVVLVAVGIVGALLSACGNGSATSMERGAKPVDQGPTALPSGSHASPSLCRTYFGSLASIAKEFGVASLERVPQIYSNYGRIVCQYLRPGPTKDYNEGLFITLAGGPNMSSCCEHEADAKAGAVYAYAVSSDPSIHVPTQKKEAARVTLPRGCATTAQGTTCTIPGVPLPTKVINP